MWLGALLTSVALRKEERLFMPYQKGMEVGTPRYFESSVTLDSGSGFIAHVVPKVGKSRDYPSQTKGKRQQINVTGPAEVVLIQADGPVSVQEK